jgi:hypothetical protein
MPIDLLSPQKPPVSSPSSLICRSTPPARLAHPTMSTMSTMPTMPTMSTMSHLTSCAPSMAFVRG